MDSRGRLHGVDEITLMTFVNFTSIRARKFAKRPNENVIGMVKNLYCDTLLPFSSYRERLTFFLVLSRAKHSSLSRQTVAFYNPS